MNDEQMEALIVGIRENEKKNYDLSETLMDFNESFTEFMAKLSEVSKLGELEESHKKISHLEESLQSIEKAIKISQVKEVKAIEEAHTKLKEEISEEFKTALQGQKSNQVVSPSYSDTSVFWREIIFTISANRKKIMACHPLLETQKVVYEGSEMIEGICTTSEEVWIYYRDQSMSKLNINAATAQMIEIKAIQKVRPIEDGLIILNSEKELMFYSSVEGKKSLATGIIGFEVLGNGQLMYQEADESMQLLEIMI